MSLLFDERGVYIQKYAFKTLQTIFSMWFLQMTIKCEFTRGANVGLEEL